MNTWPEFLVDKPVNTRAEFGAYEYLWQQPNTSTKKLAELHDKVEFRSDGEALLKGTGIEAHRIAALLDGGMTVDEVLADYPSLARDAVEAAGTYADAYPKAGRPYPRTTIKRALRGAGLEALDEAFGDGDASE